MDQGRSDDSVISLSVRTATAVLEAAGLTPIDRLPDWANIADGRRVSVLPGGGYMPSRGPATAAVICRRAHDVVCDFVRTWEEGRRDLVNLVERIIWALTGPDVLHHEIHQVRRDDVPDLVDRLILESERAVRHALYDAGGDRLLIPVRTDRG